jgi:SAM-dependent methyltransferase
MIASIEQGNSFPMSTDQASQCPACRSQNTRTILNVTAKQSAQHFVIEEGDKERNRKLTRHIEELWGGDHCVVRECQKCGFGFASPFAAGDAMFYNLAVPFVKYPENRWEFKRTVAELAHANTSGKTCLDVGAGFGFFLDKISERYFSPSEITAIEYNEISLRRLRAKGYNALDKDVMSDYFKNLESCFDYVFLFHIIEHLDRIDQVFERLHCIMRPNGSVFIAVPNPHRTALQEASGSLLDMPPNHIGRWTIPAFEAVSSRHGFAVDGAELEPFSIGAFILDDLANSYVRRTQNSETIANRIRSLPRSKARKFVEAVMAAGTVPHRIPTWIGAMKRRDELGSSLWVKLNRF